MAIRKSQETSGRDVTAPSPHVGNEADPTRSGNKPSRDPAATGILPGQTGVGQQTGMVSQGDMSGDGYDDPELRRERRDNINPSQPR
jgi:hypothetical protein